MATFTRINGDAQVVLNSGLDNQVRNANAVLINTGIAAPLQAYKIQFVSGNLAAELTTGGAVETVLRMVEGNATVLAYQVDTTANLAPVMTILTERSGWGTSTLPGDQALTNILTQAGNIGLATPVTIAQVSSAVGLKIAATSAV
jgi:hypothetical protein